MISVVTRTKDRPTFLRRAALSVLGSRGGVGEWIIVNDGGSPKSVDETADFASRQGISTQVIHFASSQGMESASNAGVRRATGSLIHIHDDDDTVLPDFYNCATQSLNENPDSVAVATLVIQVNEIISPDGTLIEKSSALYKDLASVSLPHLMMENPMPPIALVFRRAAYDAVGGFNEALPLLGDWDFHFKLCHLGPIHLVRQPLARYHWRPRHFASADGNSIRDLTNPSENVLADLDSDALRKTYSVTELWAIGASWRRQSAEIGWRVAKRPRARVLRQYIKRGSTRPDLVGSLIRRLISIAR